MYIKEKSKHILNKFCKVYYWHNINPKNKGIIVFLPGSSLNHTSMISLATLFYREGYSTLLYDQRGTGFSSKPMEYKEYSPVKFSEDLFLILKKENIKKPIFITHSYGIVPAAYYVAKTHNAQRIISIYGSNNFKETINSKFIYYLFQFILRHNGILYATKNELKAKILNKKIKYMDFSKAKTSKEISNLFANESTLEYVHANRIMAYRNLHTDISKELSKIMVPVMNIIGKQDKIVTAKANHNLRKLLKNFKEIKIDGGHDDLIIKPKKMFKLILKNII